MKKKLSLLKYEIINTFVVAIVGTLLHFLYEWSGYNTFIGFFSAINESVWEHLKILFIPMLITSILGSIFFKKEYQNYLWIKTKSILLALIFIIVFFYTSSGVLGKNIAIINIASFYIAIILSEIYTYQKLKVNNSHNNDILAIIILLILLFLFILFTFVPPHIGMFKDPLTNTYGILKKM